MQTNCNITIYNKYLDPVKRLDVYQKVFIENVFWTDARGATRPQGGLATEDKVYIAIPFTSSPEDSIYVEPKAFLELADKSGHYTLAPGDRIVQEYVDLEITGKISDLDRAYDAYTISNVDTRSLGSEHMRHWGVSAK